MCCKCKIYPGFQRVGMKKECKFLKLFFLNIDYILRSDLGFVGLNKIYFKQIAPVFLLVFNMVTRKQKLQMCPLLCLLTAPLWKIWRVKQ